MKVKKNNIVLFHFKSYPDKYKFLQKNGVKSTWLSTIIAHQPCPDLIHLSGTLIILMTYGSIN